MSSFSVIPEALKGASVNFNNASSDMDRLANRTLEVCSELDRTMRMVLPSLEQCGVDMRRRAEETNLFADSLKRIGDVYAMTEDNVESHIQPSDIDYSDPHKPTGEEDKDDETDPGDERKTPSKDDEEDMDEAEPDPENDPSRNKDKNKGKDGSGNGNGKGNGENGGGNNDGRDGGSEGGSEGGSDRDSGSESGNGSGSRSGGNSGAGTGNGDSTYESSSNEEGGNGGSGSGSGYGGGHGGSGSAGGYGEGEAAASADIGAEMGDMSALPHIGTIRDILFDNNFASVGDRDAALRIYQALIKEGYSPEAAAAILGNLEAEHGFSTAWLGDQGAIGIGLWTGDSKNALVDFAKSLGKDPTDLEVQIQFLVKNDLYNKLGADGVNKLKGMTDFVDATDFVCDEYQATADYTSEAAYKASMYAQPGRNHINWDRFTWSEETKSFVLDLQKRREAANYWYQDHFKNGQLL